MGIEFGVHRDQGKVDKLINALIYSGIHHAFTRYKQPVVDASRFVRFVETRMGNLVHKELAGKVFTIFLHAPWVDKDFQNDVFPAEGVIDSLFLEERHLGPAGFDLAGSPFGELGGAGSLYMEGYHPFALKLFADGYVYTKPISEYQDVTVDKRFITERNIRRAVEQLANPEFKMKVTGVDMLRRALEGDADIARRFQGFH